MFRFEIQSLKIFLDSMLTEDIVKVYVNGVGLGINMLRGCI